LPFTCRFAVDVSSSPLQYIVVIERDKHLSPKVSYFLVLLMNIYDAA